jgi:hypothetical protein
LGLPIEVKNIKNLYKGSRHLKLSDIKIRETIYIGVGIQAEPYIITDVLGEGKFKAVPKGIEKRVGGYAGNEEIFDISIKKTTQQGIKLTPEIKAKIRGEAPAFKASGKQFETKTIKHKPVSKIKGLNELLK